MFPLQAVHLDWTDAVVAKRQTQVLVAGGGTAGALAAAGSVDKGADTIVVDYFNDLGWYQNDGRRNGLLPRCQGQCLF
jgi:heterodisulfide reductase subunit A-like polyferredoxin